MQVISFWEALHLSPCCLDIQLCFLPLKPRFAERDSDHEASLPRERSGLLYLFRCQRRALARDGVARRW